MIFGNSSFFDMRVGESVTYRHATIVLNSVDRQFADVQVDGRQVRLKVSKLTLPVELNGIRLSVADNQYVKHLSDDASVHGLLSKDALLCVSDASRPLLDPDRYVFPISRRDGYTWPMGEDSHMFAYLGPHWNNPARFRSHEGIDFDMHDGRGIEKHPVVAIEDGVVAWSLASGLSPDNNEACVLIKSAANRDTYYVYKHLYAKRIAVTRGMVVQRGTPLGYIWSDGIWGHLHFAVVHSNTVPDYPNRYVNTVNVFPHLHELWCGPSRRPAPVFTHGEFAFGRLKGASRNVRYAHAYTPVLGCGWRIDHWCGADVLEAVPFENEGFILLKKVVHQHSRAACTNPDAYYEFAVDVEPGVYTIAVLVGNYYDRSHQRVVAEHVELGTFSLGKGVVAWTERREVSVTGTTLTLRIYYDETVGAGICKLSFAKVAETTPGCGARSDAQAARHIGEAR